MQITPSGDPFSEYLIEVGFFTLYSQIAKGMFILIKNYNAEFPVLVSDKINIKLLQENTFSFLTILIGQFKEFKEEFNSIEKEFMTYYFIFLALNIVLTVFLGVFRLVNSRKDEKLTKRMNDLLLRIDKTKLKNQVAKFENLALNLENIVKKKAYTQTGS